MIVMTNKESQETYSTIKHLAEPIGVTDDEITALIFMNEHIIEDFREQRLSSKEIGKSLKVLLEKLNNK
jgi:plasmid maintenance system antidote protein VapI